MSGGRHERGSRDPVDDDGRIAAQRQIFVPLEIDGNPLWRHECGAQRKMPPGALPNYCTSCNRSQGDWRQLYVRDAR